MRGQSFKFWPWAAIKSATSPATKAPATKFSCPCAIGGIALTREVSHDRIGRNNLRQGPAAARARILGGMPPGAHPQHSAIAQMENPSIDPKHLERARELSGTPPKMPAIIKTVLELIARRRRKRLRHLMGKL